MTTTYLIYLVLGLLGVFGYMAVCWLFYLAIMNLKRNKDKVTSPFIRTLGFWFYYVGYALDIGMNIFIGTLLFLDPPRAWLFTDRLERYIPEQTWRGSMARWICANILDPFDPSGEHC